MNGREKSITADRKIQDGALRRSAVKRGFRDGHLAHRILFHPRVPPAVMPNDSRESALLPSARMAVAVPRSRLLENGDEHRRNILEEIFGLGVIENGGVLPQFVSHLINDEAAAGRERIVAFLQERPFLVDLREC